MFWLYGIGLALLALLVYMRLIEPSRLKVERVTVRLCRLPRALDGLKVCVMGDLHVSWGGVGSKMARRAIEAANALQPDLIFVVGDMVHWGSGVEYLIPLLAQLRARYGIFACLGNHDHNCPSKSPQPPMWGGRVVSVSEWKDYLSQAGVRLLVNEAAPLTINGEQLWVAGVDDAHTGRSDLAQALYGVDEERCVLLLSHSPDIVDEPNIGKVDLVLSGHTHGGQVVIPGFGVLYAPCRRPKERAAGLRTVNGTTLYVTRGVASLSVGRFNCPPEVTLLTLQCSA